MHEFAAKLPESLFIVFSFFVSDCSLINKLNFFGLTYDFCDINESLVFSTPDIVGGQLSIGGITNCFSAMSE